MVEWKKLGDICEKTSNIKWKDQADDKIYKYIDLSSVSLDSHKVIVTTDVCKQNAPSRAQQIVCANDILLGTTRPTLKRYCQIPSYLDKNICSTGFCIFRANKEYVLSRWLFHNIGSSKFWDYCELKQQGAGYPCLSNSDAFAYMIPIPSIEEQNRIVGILDTFTASIDNLKQQIAQRRKQYEYFRDQLLDLEGKEGVEMKKLGEISIIKTGTKPEKFNTSGLYKYINAGTSESGFVDIFNCDGNVTTTPSRGQGGIGYVGFQNDSFWLGPLCYQIRSVDDKTISDKYIFYYLSAHNDYLLKYKSEGGTPALNAVDLKKIECCIPPLSEQQRIVSILDTFESSINNLEQQLAQREKQYEFYRNKLLTFE